MSYQQLIVEATLLAHLVVTPLMKTAIFQKLPNILLQNFPRRILKVCLH